MWNKKPIVWGLVVLLGCLIATFGRREFTSKIDARAFDLDDQWVYPLRSIEGRAVVLIFLSFDCPISNQYAPEIQRLEATFSRKGIRFWLVYPNADETTEAVRKHTREYVRMPIDHERIRIPPRGNQPDIFRDCCMSRACPLAIDHLVKVVWRRDISRFHSYLVRAT